MLLLLDAAFPPGPTQWVDDMDAVGAGGGFVYVVGPFLNYTAAHVAEARKRGKQVAPIIVPGNQPGDAGAMLLQAQRYGFSGGAALFDFEAGSEPAAAWWAGAKATFERAGFLADRYGTTSVLGLYQPGDADWIAQWIRAGVLQPIPPLPQGWGAWQFVDDVNINGHQYDVTVADPAFLGGQPMTQFTAEDDQMLRDQEGTATRVDDDLVGGFGAGGLKAELDAISNKLDQVLNAIKAPAPVDVNALASALQPLLPAGADPAAVATAVMAEMAKRLGMAAA